MNKKTMALLMTAAAVVAGRWVYNELKTRGILT